VRQKPVCSNQQTGDMGCTTIHESKKPPVASLAESMNYDGNKSCTVWVGQSVDCLKALSNKSVWKYVRTGVPPGVAVSSTVTDAQSYDLDSFDHGMVNIWSQGQVSGASGAAVDVADVFMDYEWEVKEPNSSDLVSSPIPVVDSLSADIWEQKQSVAFVTTAGSHTPALVAAGTVLATDMIPDSDNTLNCSVTQGVSNYQIILTPPKIGFYLAIGVMAARTVGGATPVTWAFDPSPGVHAANPMTSNCGGATVLPYDIFLSVGTGTTYLFDKNMQVLDSSNVAGAHIGTQCQTLTAFEVVTVGDYFVLDISGSSNLWSTQSDDVVGVPGNCYYGLTIVITELPPALSRIMKRKSVDKKSDMNALVQIAELRELVNKLVQKKEVSTSSGMLVALGEQKKTKVGENGKDDKSEPQSKPRSNSTDSLVLVDAAGNTAVSTPALATAIASASGVSPKQTYAAAASKPKGDDRKKQVDLNTKKK